MGIYLLYKIYHQGKNHAYFFTVVSPAPSAAPVTSLVFLSFLFWVHCEACRILVLSRGIEPTYSLTYYFWVLQPTRLSGRWDVCQISVCVCMRVQLCPTLCNPMDCSPLGSRDLCGISQARILEWVAISYPKGSAWPRDWIHVSCSSCIGRLFLYHCTTWEAQISVMGKSNISL